MQTEEEVEGYKVSGGKEMQPARLRYGRQHVGATEVGADGWGWVGLPGAADSDQPEGVAGVGEALLDFR
jgi:hypothetical protein